MRIQEDGATWQEALSTPAFWTFSVGAALYGLVASGIGLFNESILAERGFGADVYYQTLVVTALTALAGNFGGGWLAMRMSLSTLLAVSLFVLARSVSRRYRMSRRSATCWCGRRRWGSAAGW